MARRTDRITITAEGRDKGKAFVLTEMAADQGERWALRALLALTNTGAAIPEEALGAGMAGLAAVGVQALGLLQHETVQPLLDELWPSCVRFIPPHPNVPPQEILSGAASQIEEVSTRLTIYKALLKLHTDFSMPDVPPTSGPDSTGEEVKEHGYLSSMSRALLGLLSRHVWLR
jgi:hypothetical protein